MRNIFLAGAAALALASGATIVSAQSTPAPTETAAEKAADPSWPAEYKTYYETLTPKQKEGWWALTDAQRKQVYDLPADQRAAVWTSIEAQLAGASPAGAAAGAAAPSAPPSNAATPTEGANPATSAPADSAAPATSTSNATDAADAINQADAANPSGAAVPDAASPAEQVQANPRGAGEASATPPNPATADSSVPPAQPADPSYNAGPYKGALTAPPAEAMNKDYPLCSRTVQDSCRNRGGV